MNPASNEEPLGAAGNCSPGAARSSLVGIALACSLYHNCCGVASPLAPENRSDLVSAASFPNCPRVNWSNRSIPRCTLAAAVGFPVTELVIESYLAVRSVSPFTSAQTLGEIPAISNSAAAALGELLL